MNKLVYELDLKCPECNTEIKLISELHGPVIILCQGCSRCIVFQDNNVYTVPSKFVEYLMNKYQTKTCGKIVLTNISQQSKNMINDQKISSLKKLLSKNIDVNDFLSKIHKI